MIIKLQHPHRHDHGGDDPSNDFARDVVDTERFYFELQAEGNYETIATSEIYESREAAMLAISLIRHAEFTLNDATR